MKKIAFFDKIKEKFGKIFNTKKKSIILMITTIVVMSLLAISVFLPKSSKSNSKKESNKTTEISVASYASSIEKKLTDMLLMIDYVKDVSVFVMVDSTPQIQYLTETEETVTKNGTNETTTKSTTVVFEKNGSISTPVVVTTIMPKVTGVLIVVNKIDASTKLNITSSISVVLNVESSCISILQER